MPWAPKPNRQFVRAALASAFTTDLFLPNTDMVLHSVIVHALDTYAWASDEPMRSMLMFLMKECLTNIKSTVTLSGGVESDKVGEVE